MRKEVEELKRRVQKLEEQQAAKPEARRSATSVNRVPGSWEAAPQASSPAQQQATAQQTAPPPPPPPPTPPDSLLPPPPPPTGSRLRAPNTVLALRERWSRVAKKCTQAEISDVLGQPSKEIRIDGKLVWYYYYPGIGGASVFFKRMAMFPVIRRPNVGWW